MTEEMHDKVQATVKLVASALDIPEDDLGPRSLSMENTPVLGDLFLSI